MTLTYIIRIRTSICMIRTNIFMIRTTLLMIVTNMTRLPRAKSCYSDLKNNMNNLKT